MLYAHTLGRAARCHSRAIAAAAGDRRVSFAELDTRVRRLAAELVARGLRAGDRLAVLLPNCLDFLELTYACCRLGVLLVPLNTRYAVPELDEVLADAQPRGLIRHSALLRPTAPVEWEVVQDETPLAGSDGPVPPPFYDPEAILGLFYTSGTTGRAKGAMLTHGNLLANMHHSLQIFELAPGAVWLHAAPMFHLADFPAVFNVAALGATQVTVPRFDPALLCEAIARYRATHTVLIPTMINLLTQSPELDRHDLSSLRSIFYGGSPIAPEIIRRVREKLPGVGLMQGYGMTETSPLLTVLKDDEHTGERLLSCGRPMPGVELEIIDDEGQPLAPGASGEIAARGANVMKGYWNKPLETSRAIVNGWMRTGDIGHRDEDGYFYIADRKKDMIISGGENVYSTEVEAALYRHAAVREAAVIGIPDAQWGELVTACVVLKDGAPVTAEDLTGHCRQYLANYKVPKRVIFYSGELPKSGTGKILKRALREQFWTGQARAVS